MSDFHDLKHNFSTIFFSKKGGGAGYPGALLDLPLVDLSTLFPAVGLSFLFSAVDLTTLFSAVDLSMVIYDYRLFDDICQNIDHSVFCG